MLSKFNSKFKDRRFTAREIKRIIITLLFFLFPGDKKPLEINISKPNFYKHLKYKNYVEISQINISAIFIKYLTMNMAPLVPLPGTHFITITLPPKAYKFKAKEQFTRVKPLIVDTMMAHTNDYCLIAELTKQANVHFHGWYTEKYEGATLFIIDHLKQRHLGYVKINDALIKETDRTYKYMLKDIVTTKKLIPHPVLSSKPIITKTVIPVNHQFKTVPNGAGSTYEQAQRVVAYYESNENTH